jgi:hypothetical protein
VQSKPIIYLLFIIIITTIFLQGCTAGGYVSGRIKDVKHAKISDKCELSEISIDDYVEFQLKDGKPVRGKISWIQSDVNFNMEYLTEKDYVKTQNISWDRILEANRLEVGISRRVAGMATGFVLDVIPFMLFMLFWGSSGGSVGA